MTWVILQLPFSIILKFTMITVMRLARESHFHKLIYEIHFYQQLNILTLTSGKVPLACAWHRADQQEGWMNVHGWEEVLSHLPVMKKIPGLEPKEHEILDWKRDGMHGSQHWMPTETTGINWGAFINIDARTAKIETLRRRQAWLWTCLVTDSLSFISYHYNEVTDMLPSHG